MSDFNSFYTNAFCKATRSACFRSLLLNESCLIGISLLELRSGEQACDSFHILRGEKLALLVTMPPTFYYDRPPASLNLGKFSIYCCVFGLWHKLLLVIVGVLKGTSLWFSLSLSFNSFPIISSSLTKDSSTMVVFSLSDFSVLSSFSCDLSIWGMDTFCTGLARPCTVAWGVLDWRY